MPFAPGQSGNPSGAKGPQKFTRAAKEAFEFAFDESGGAEALAEWASDNRSDFYRLFAKLIPRDVKLDATVAVSLVQALEELDRSKS